MGKVIADITMSLEPERTRVVESPCATHLFV
jgi:hypothetical protein